VKKIPYTERRAEHRVRYHDEAAQLFVTPDFAHLGRVLEEFASRMAFRVGGLEGIQKAIECHNVTTCQYSSGLQVSGVFTEVLADTEQNPIYIRATGQARSRRATRNSLARTRLPRGRFGSPVGLGRTARLRPSFSLTTN
jgi:phenylalanine-4-hydroxylase